MRKFKIDDRLIIFLGGLLNFALLSGCTVYRAPELKQEFYWINQNKVPSSIAKVVLVELDNESPYPQVTADVTDALYQEIQKKQVFGIKLLRKSDPACRSLQLNAYGVTDIDNRELARKTLNCDAIILGTITKYYPYPHMVMGLRLKMIDLRDGKLLWALEQVWDTADKSTEYQMKHFYSDQKRVDFPDLRMKLLNVSSLEFLKFVAYQVSVTLE
ncbi:MAG: hypothetical protein ACYTBP_02095 [Planctomycetota bacterium]|jgi:hypothetical protein